MVAMLHSSLKFVFMGASTSTHGLYSKYTNDILYIGDCRCLVDFLFILSERFPIPISAMWKSIILNLSDLMNWCNLAEIKVTLLSRTRLVTAWHGEDSCVRSRHRSGCR